MIGDSETRTRTADDDASDTLDGFTLPTLTVALDGRTPNRTPVRYKLAGVGAVAVGRGASAGMVRERDAGRWRARLTLEDDQASREHAWIRETDAGWVVSDRGSRNGTWVDGERVDGEPVPLHDGAVVQVGRVALVFRRVLASLLEEDAAPPSGPHDDLRSLHPELVAQLAVMGKLVDGPAPPIFVRGPTGSGKEVVARAIHDLYAEQGREGRFVAVNCGALPSELVEAELFGSRRGAFSGAVEHREGLVRAAAGGTLFLDEIGDLAPASQAALLRVLQEREVVPVGGTEPVRVDLKIVSATHQDVDALIAEERFREDLHARLAHFELRLPALADRTEDLGAIVQRLVDTSSLAFSRDAVRWLTTHAWPRNVRELQAALSHALAVADGDTLRARHFPKAREIAAPAAQPNDDLRTRLVGELTQHRGNVAAVARALGKDRRQIHRYLKRYGIDPAAYRTR